MAAPANRQEFAALLNEARQRQHLSIRAVGRIAEVPATTAQGWLNGKHFPTPALRGNYQLLVDRLGLADQMPDDLWEDSWAGPPTALHSGRSPYLGLRPFAVADQELFHGRVAQSRRVAEAILALGETEGNGVLALVGPSGSGKSSLLAAGVLGQEISGGVLAGWTGRSASVLKLAAGEDAAATGEPGRRLVVVDQLEEALSLPSEPRRLFFETLERLAGEAVVVVGMRSDAFGAASLEPALELAMSRPILLPPMTRDELREVILRPAESFGVAVEEELVRVLLDDVAPGTATSRVAPGALPLLSSALLLTWAVSDGRRLKLSDYHHVGGVASAVERLAEQVFQSLDPDQQSAIERLFIRLVRVSGDQLVHETLALAEVDEATVPAMNAFVAARMLTTSGDEVRISHQALLTHWRRLHDWLDEHRDDLVVLDKLRKAAEVWTDSGRDPAALIPVQRLAVFTEWLESGRKQKLLSDVERDFVEASEAHYANVLEQEREAGRRLRRRGSVALALAAVGLALALVAGFLYLQGRGSQLQAEHARLEAQSRQVATAAGELRSRDPNLQAQLSVLSRRLAVTTESTSAVLSAASLAVPTRWLGQPDAVLAVSADGRLVARGDGAGRVTLWTADELAGSPGRTFAAADGALAAIALGGSGDSRLLAVAGKGTAKVWDVTAEPRLLADLLPTADGTAAAFDPAGRSVAFGTSAGEVRLWTQGKAPFDPAAALRLDPEPGGGRPKPSALVFDTGHLYVGGPRGRLARWAVTGKPRRLADVDFPEPVASRSALSLAVSPDGASLAAGLATEGVLRWRLAGSRATPQPALGGFGDGVGAVGFSVDGKLLAAGGAGRQAKVLDAATGELRRTLPGPAAVTGAAFAGEELITTDSAGTLQVWPADDPTWRTTGPELSSLSTDGAGSEWLASGTLSDGIKLWRVPGRPRPMPAPRTGLAAGKQSGAVAVAPDGSYLLGATFDGRVLSWPLTGEGAAGPASVLDVGLGYVSAVQAAPNSRLVVAMGYVGTDCALLEADAEGRLSLLARIATPNPKMVWFSADSGTLAVAMPDRRVALWDVSVPSRPKQAGEVSGLDSAPASIAFAPKSALLAVGTDSGQVSVWDVADPARPVRTRTIDGPGSAANAVLFSPDERTLVAAGGDERIWGWNLTRAQGDPIFSLSGGPGRPLDVRFLGGDRMAVSTGDGALRVWDVDPERAAARLCGRRGQGLSAAEWDRYLPGITPADPCLPR